MVFICYLFNIQFWFKTNNLFQRSKNVFCNPVFEPDEENEEKKGNFKIDIYLEPTKKPAAGKCAYLDPQSFRDI